MIMKSLFPLAVAAALAAPFAFAGDIQTAPPASFKKVSSLVQLPDYVPGLGTLYVDPATAPIGPYLGYDKSGKLASITYMIPLKSLSERKAFDDLGQAVAGLKVDHTDVMFNPGHPGMMEPHYHVTQWLIPRTAEEKM